GRLHEDYGAKVVTHRHFRTFFDPDEEPDEISIDEIDADRPTNATVAGVGGRDTSNRAMARAPWTGPLPWGESTSGGHSFGGGRKGPGRPPLMRRLQYRMMRKVGGRMGAVPRPTHRVDDADRLELGG